MTQPLTILHITNTDWHFVKHVLPAVRLQLEAGHHVHGAFNMTDPAVMDLLRRAGVTYHPLPFHRSSIAPWQLLREWFATARLIRRLKPDMVRTSTWKPLTAVGVARQFAPGFNACYAIPGLGYMFLNHTAKALVARRSVNALLIRIARRSRTRFEVLNGDDRRWLAELIGNRAPIDLLPGLGVDTDHFTALPLPPAPPYIFVLAARLLWDKGVREFVEAARQLRAENAPVRLVLAGPFDPGNPRGINQREIDQWLQEGVVEYWGNAEDIRTVWAKAHVCVLPSYREGLSMALIEAAACARAIICSDVSGCRETIRENQSGLLVPIGDAGALTDAIRSYAEKPELLLSHGEAGRHRIATRYGIGIVQQMFLNRAEQFA